MRCLCAIAVSVAAAGAAAPPPIPMITATDFQTPHPWAAAYLSNGFFGVRPGESFEALTICTQHLHGVAVLTVLLLPLPAIALQRRWHQQWSLTHVDAMFALRTAVAVACRKIASMLQLECPFFASSCVGRCTCKPVLCLSCPLKGAEDSEMADAAQAWPMGRSLFTACTQTESLT
jgi:hypothetical protein